MWRYKDHYGWVSVTQEQWLDALLSGAFNPKAPKSWVAEQGEQGRPPVAAYSIWAKYDTARKYVIWDMATDEDARAAGYLE